MLTALLSKGGEEMFKEVWFFIAVVGVIYAGILGFNARFATKSGKLKKRRDYNTDKQLTTIIVVAFCAVAIETLWRMLTRRSSVVLNMFTDEVFYELVLYSLMFVVIYGVILVTTMAVVDVFHIGLHQIRLELDQEEKKDALEELREWLEDYDKKVQSASVDSEYEVQMEGCKMYFETHS